MDFSKHSTRTGRMLGQPNMQKIDKLPKRVRDFFKPNKEYRMVKADFSMLTPEAPLRIDYVDKLPPNMIACTGDDNCPICKAIKDMKDIAINSHTSIVLARKNPDTDKLQAWSEENNNWADTDLPPGTFHPKEFKTSEEALAYAFAHKIIGKVATPCVAIFHEPTTEENK